VTFVKLISPGHLIICAVCVFEAYTWAVVITNQVIHEIKRIRGNRRSIAQ
jgi:hypothetical protein